MTNLIEAPVLRACPNHPNGPDGTYKIADCRVCFAKTYFNFHYSGLIKQVNNALIQIDKDIEHINRWNATKPCEACLEHPGKEEDEGISNWFWNDCRVCKGVESVKELGG